MIGALLLLASLAAPDDASVGVAIEDNGDTQLLKVTGVPAEQLDVRRTGDHELTIVFPAEAPPPRSLPAAGRFIASLRLTEGSRPAVAVQLQPQARYEVVRDNGLTIQIGGADEAPTASVAALESRMSSLFPEPAAGPPPSARPDTGDGVSAGFEGVNQEGLHWGPFYLNPAIVFTYVHARGAYADVDTGPGWHDYLQFAPTLGAGVGSASVKYRGFRVYYRPSFRRFTSLKDLQHPTHELGATLDLPLGPSFGVGLYDRWVKGLLEVQEVDPGREYFATLGSFTHNAYGGALRYGGGARVGAEVRVEVDDVDFHEPSSFFPHRQESVTGIVGYDLGNERRLELRYERSWVPFTDERPEAENDASTWTLAVTGELLPLVRGEIYGGIRTQTHPGVTGAGHEYSGSVFGAYVVKEFSPGTTLGLNGGRGVYLSGFEENGFYVSTSVGATGTLPLYAGVLVSATVGYRENGYDRPAAEIGEPRHDDMFDWSAGLSRPFGRRVYIRVDYNHEKRESNLSGLSTTTDAFTAQLGLGFFSAPILTGAPGPRR